ncbi:MAG: PEP-CTERM sorting domain-containing protein [Verrucomicrobia bacterium]|nr:PEP-CTERM sorting domain-containing protein [Verrucomicrobiota bacterium]
MRKLFVFALIITGAFLGPHLRAQATVSLNFDANGVTLDNSDQTTALADGNVVQFGYYTGATAGNLFAGSWVALTGDGSANPSINTVINGVSSFGSSFAGQFYYSAISLTASVTTGQIMAVRFYNSTTVVGSTFYGAVSSNEASMIWPGVSNTLTFQIGDTGTTWLNNNVAFTGTAIPEPAACAVLLGALTLAGVAWRRRGAI